jgi:hypothetical protein
MSINNSALLLNLFVISHKMCIKCFLVNVTRNEDSQQRRNIMNYEELNEKHPLPGFIGCFEI